jgi:phosphoribosyl-ATP pyrophosphohydrolase/phosphoribosyl-AMP cyclohydrolase
MYKSMMEKIDWKKCNNLVPVIIQDGKSLAVLMLGFMNHEALDLTVKTAKVHFWSRTKNRIWMKGEESGNILHVVDIKLDCDNDSLLILTSPIGNTCHLGMKSCFDYSPNFLFDLEKTIDDRISAIDDRIANQNSESYVSNLVKSGVNKIAQKVGEEATEVVIAALCEGRDEFLGESADLLFHLLILLRARGLELHDVVEVLKSRR